MSVRVTVCLAALCFPMAVYAQTDTPHVLTATEAKTHIGENATVCGTVASARYSTEGRQPTFLNLDKAYPQPIFTVLIWGANRDKFGKPEELYKDKRICVTGKIEDYRNAPEMILDDPHQLVLQDEKPH
jgi:micrococcal nuclease